MNWLPILLVGKGGKPPKKDDKNFERVALAVCAAIVFGLLAFVFWQIYKG